MSRTRWWVLVAISTAPLLLAQCNRTSEPPGVPNAAASAGVTRAELLSDGFFPEPRGQGAAPDPLVQRALESVKNWSKVQTQARRTLIHTWLVPDAKSALAGMKGFGILVVDIYAQDPSALENEGLIFVSAPTRQKPEIVRLPDVGGFRPRFQWHGASDAVSEKYGRFRQRQMVFFPLRFLGLKGQFQVQFMPLGSDLEFETAPVKKWATAFQHLPVDPQGVPDPSAVAGLLGQSGFVQAPR